MQMILSGGAEIFYEAKLPVLRRCGESEAEMISSTANQSSEIGKSVVMKKWLDRAAKKGRHRPLQQVTVITLSPQLRYCFTGLSASLA
jgi:cellobiose-specific phosphotransferase system component IIB